MVVSDFLLTFAVSNLNNGGQVMITTIKIQKRVKSLNEISIQTERIITLYYKGYGTDRMYQFCETIMLSLLKKYGY